MCLVTNFVVTVCWTRLCACIPEETYFAFNTESRFSSTTTVTVDWACLITVVSKISKFTFTAPAIVKSFYHVRLSIKI